MKKKLEKICKDAKPVYGFLYECQYNNNNNNNNNNKGICRHRVDYRNISYCNIEIRRRMDKLT